MRYRASLGNFTQGINCRNMNLACGILELTKSPGMRKLKAQPWNTGIPKHFQNRRTLALEMAGLVSFLLHLFVHSWVSSDMLMAGGEQKDFGSW